MVKDIVVGIDPGVGGSVCFVDAERGEVVSVHDMPLEKMKTGSKQVDARALNDLISDGVNACAPCRVVVVVEKVGPMPRDTPMTAFRFGNAVGVIRGVLVSHAFRVEYVAPMTWKKHFHMIGTDKDYSRTIAKQRFPNACLPFKKDHNKADAMLLAAFGVDKFVDRKW